MDAIHKGGDDRTRIYQRVVESVETGSRKQDMKAQSSPGLRDSVDISDAAYRMLKDSGELQKATSGKDELRLIKGDNENKATVRFSDSVLINRAVSRGYITVNGKASVGEA